MWVLAAVTIGSGIMGVPGMLLGVPTAATIYRLLGADVNHRLKKKPAAQETSIPAPLPEKKSEPEPVPAQNPGKKKKKK